MQPAIPEKIGHAVRILLGAGASRVYIFGSAAPDQGIPGREPADLDLAVEGLPKDAFYRTVGELLWELRIPVDLIDLDSSSGFVSRLRESGRLRRVA